MKIEFEDGSFIEIIESNEKNKLTFVLCGFKNPELRTIAL